MKIFYKILSLPFQISNLLIDFFYKTGIKKPVKMNIPIISVGNISFGGEGKTPIVIAISKFFIQKGIRPAILIRGYKGKKEREGAVVSIGENWEEFGDEAQLIAKNVSSASVIAGKDRVKSAYKAMEMGVDILLLDDGFQFRKLYRDLNIVILSPILSFKREFLFSIYRADAILINADFEDERFIKMIKEKKPKLPLFRFVIKTTGIFDINGNEIDLRNKKVIAFCGIANPGRFVKSLFSISVKPEKIIFFPDHYKYTLKDIRKIEREARENGAKIAVTTEKDFVRLGRLPFSIQIVYSKIEACPEEEFYDFLVERLKL